MASSPRVIHCPPGNAAWCDWWPQKVSSRQYSKHPTWRAVPRLGVEPLDPANWRTAVDDRKHTPVDSAASPRGGDRETIMHETPHVDLTTEPGVATVILGSGMELPDDYRHHPRVQAIDGADLPPDPADILGLLPSQTRVVLVGGLLSRPVFAAFRTAMHRRRLIYVTRDSRTELKAAIDQVFAKKNAEPVRAPEPPQREALQKRGKGRPMGAVTKFVAAHANPNAQGVSAEARRLLALAQAEGLETTVDSLANAIGRWQGKQGYTSKRRRAEAAAATQPAITPQAQLYAMGGDQEKVLQLVDDAIAAFQLIREYVQTTTGSSAKEQALTEQVTTLEGELAKERAKSETLAKKVQALKDVFGNL
jgi:hypothetical protein